ncbi:MAG: hypothetical protein HY908_09220 [Myxococcales bacterium]|nr:hypothetical protein [Myxococcales bacterium]
MDPEAPPPARPPEPPGGSARPSAALRASTASESTPSPSATATAAPRATTSAAAPATTTAEPQAALEPEGPGGLAGGTIPVDRWVLYVAAISIVAVAALYLLTRLVVRLQRGARR